VAIVLWQPGYDGASAACVGGDDLEGVIEMRVLVSVDMEGIAGVVHGDDIRPGHGEYERNRKLLTAEVNAAVRGIHAYEPDAQVLVTEAHAEFRNLLPELLDRRAELLRGTPKPGGMMAGLAADMDAVLFIGYHGKAGMPRSVMWVRAQPRCCIRTRRVTGSSGKSLRHWPAARPSVRCTSTARCSWKSRCCGRR
jgi:hypothetical protein